MIQFIQVSQRCAVLLACLGWAWVLTAAEGTNTVPSLSSVHGLSLRQAIERALLHNRDLQIERVNPVVAGLAIGVAYGYYDPILYAEGRRESATDTGGFDPADFSADATYDAESYIARFGLNGVLPSGMTYNLGGNYANSTGQRNFLNFDSYKVTASITVQQPLLKDFWTDQGRTAIKVSRKNRTISELGVVFLTTDIVNQTQRAYYELLYAEENLKIRQRLIEARDGMLSGIQRKIQQGLGTIPEAQLAQAQLASAQTDWHFASNHVVLSGNALRILIGDDFLDVAAPPLRPSDPLLLVPVELNLSESFQRGLARRPDLLQLREDLDRSNLEVKYRRNQLFPSLDVVAGYGRKGASTAQAFPPGEPQAPSSAAFDQLGHGAAPSDVIGLIFSVPLSRTAERASFRSSKELRTQVTLRLRQREELVRREVSDAVSTARSSILRLEAARNSRQFAQAALEAEEKKLAGGTSSLFFVLQLQDDLVSSLAVEARAKADYNQAISQLGFAEGTLLDKSRIYVESD